MPVKGNRNQTRAAGKTSPIRLLLLVEIDCLSVCMKIKCAYQNYKNECSDRKVMCTVNTQPVDSLWYYLFVCTICCHGDV